MTPKYVLFINASNIFHLYPVNSIVAITDGDTNNKVNFIVRSKSGYSDSIDTIVINTDTNTASEVAKSISDTIASAKSSVVVIADNVSKSYIDPRIISTVSPATSTVAIDDLRVGGDLTVTGNSVVGGDLTVTGNSGFFGESAIAQPASVNQAALTNESNGTYDGIIEAVGDTSTSNVSQAINNNFTELHTLLNEVRTALVGLGLMKGGA